MSLHLIGREQSCIKISKCVTNNKSYETEPVLGCFNPILTGLFQTRFLLKLISAVSQPIMPRKCACMSSEVYRILW